MQKYNETALHRWCVTTLVADIHVVTADHYKKGDALFLHAGFNADINSLC